MIKNERIQGYKKKKKKEPQKRGGSLKVRPLVFLLITTIIQKTSSKEIEAQLEEGAPPIQCL